MPIPVTKLFLQALGAGGFTFLANKPGDFLGTYEGFTATMALAGITDLNGDGIADLILSAPAQGNGSNASNQDAGRIYVELSQPLAGSTTKLGDPTTEIVLSGKRGGDLAGVAVGSIADLNGDGLAEILVGAPGLDGSTSLVDAGAGFVVWGSATPTALSLGSIGTAGYVISGAAAGDRAGATMLSIADLNADGRQEVLIGAAGNDLGGLDAGAAYVVFGKATTTTVKLVNMGTAGYRVRGAAAGDGAGSALGQVADLNGDGRAEILVGASGNDAGGLDAGAAYVVFGKATTSEVNLATLGANGYRILGQAGEHAGSSVTGLGDVNGDGRADVLVGAEGGNKAYVVFGKTGTADVLLGNVAAGLGGYAILAEAPGDLAGMTVVGAGDLNGDGIADMLLGAPHNAEGGANAGAVYAIWGGANRAVDLALVAQGIGGGKIVGTAGSLTGAAVAVLADANGDGRADLFIGSPGAGGEAARVVFTPAAWQPDANIYGSNAAEVMGAGYGALHLIGSGNDSIFGLGGDDSISAGAGNDQVDGGSGADTLLGEAGDDSLDGGTGNDSLLGGAGNDTYLVDSSGDVVVEAAASGSDTVVASVAYTLGANLEALVLVGAAHAGTGNAEANSLTGAGGNDSLAGAGGDDTLLGNAGDDSLDGGAGADSMVGGTGNDTYLVDSAADVVVEAAGEGDDTLLASLDTTLAANVETLVLLGSAHHGTGNAEANRLVGGSGADSLEGLAGADTLEGGGGDDTLDGGSGQDLLVGGTGNDTYVLGDGADVVSEAADGGSDTVLASADATLAANVETLVLLGAAHAGTGNATANTLVGNNLGNVLSGAGGDDTLLAGSGDDSLDGGSGADSMRGGAGNDSYAVDNAGDVVVEAAGGGDDTVFASVDYTLTDGEIETLALTGAAHHATGNAAANTLLGGSGDDVLDGAGGADSMAGGAGHDTYLVDNLGDVVSEAPGEGVDTIIASLDWTLGEEVEALVLAGAAHHGTGNAGDNSLVGGSGDDSLEGLAGNDTLDGAAGADTMAGGSGDDTYIISDAGDVVVEAADGGFDTVVVNSDWTLAGNIEAVQVVGSGHALTGNAGANQLSGNSGSDTLDGGAGDDTELGGDGNDVLVSAAGEDMLVGGSGDDRFVIKGGLGHIEDFLGHDTIDASEASGDSRIDLSGDTLSQVGGQDLHLGIAGSTAAPLDVQFLQDLTGSFADDITMVRSLVPQIVATLQAAQPNSQFGVSTFRDKAIGSFGGAGDWVYEQYLALATDTAALTSAYAGMVANSGADGPEAQIEALMQLALHSADVGFRLNAARFVVLFTDAPFHQAGDGLAAGITMANNGDGIMDGTPAGTGEDYPLVAQVRLALEAANIIPIFAVAGGFDATYQNLVSLLGRGAEVTLTADSSNVVAALNAGLTAATHTEVEDAWGGAGQDTLLGNASDNSLHGNGGDDSLDGALGADSMAGGTGNDTYLVDNAADQVAELAGEGHDTVLASVDYTLAANVEALVLAGAAHAGTGNAEDNSLTGGAGDDTLLGLDGADTLDGGSGADSLAGGLGDDTYLIADSTALVVELAGEGHDTVRVGFDYTLGAEVEDLVLTGAALAGTGNALANTLGAASGDTTLQGAAGNDTLLGGDGQDSLDGGLDADSMAGGAGNDTYLVDNTADQVSEAAGAGTDAVLASVDYTLAANLEALVLAAPGLTGSGNAQDNSLLGSSGAETLLGLDGNDTLDGGAGADSLVGGNGQDLFLVDNAGDITRELAGGGFDTVRAELDWTLGSNLEALVLAGAALRGTGNTLDNVITANDLGDTLSGSGGNDTLLGGAGADSLVGGTGADSMAGGQGDDTYSVDNLADQVVENAGEGIELVKASVSFTLGANVENLTFSGTLGLVGTGNGLANRLVGANGNDTLLGGDGNDQLNGGLGADSMAGGQGDDTYTVDNTADLVVEAGGEGIDLVRTTVDYTLGANVEKLALVGPAGLLGRGNALANTITGDSGNDTLVGGGGADLLSGGLGSDAFRFDSIGDRGDIISGYVAADDRLEVSAAGFGGGLVAGADLLALGRYAENLTGAATSAAGVGQFIFETDVKKLWWDADGAGGAAGVVVATLTAVASFGAGEIIVIA